MGAKIMNRTTEGARMKERESLARVGCLVCLLALLVCAPRRADCIQCPPSGPIQYYDQWSGPSWEYYTGSTIDNFPLSNVRVARFGRTGVYGPPLGPVVISWDGNIHPWWPGFFNFPHDDFVAGVPGAAWFSWPAECSDYNGTRHPAEAGVL